MSKHIITANDKVLFGGKKFTMPEFQETYGLDTIEEAIAVANTLAKKGKVKKVDERNNDQKTFDKVADEEHITKLADQLEAEEHARKDRQAELKRDGRATYEEVEVDYPTYGDAVKAELYFKEKLRIKDTSIVTRNGSAKLVLYNITDAELNFINRTYTAEKAVNFTLGAVDKTASSIAGAVDYTAKNIISPTAQILAKTGVGLLKSLAHTAVKTGSTLISAGSKGVKDTVDAVKNDPEVIKAQRELIGAKDNISRKINNRGGAGGSKGITVK